jgi:hypothetical protein
MRMLVLNVPLPAVGCYLNIFIILKFTVTVKLVIKLVLIFAAIITVSFSATIAAAAVTAVTVTALTVTLPNR